MLPALIGAGASLLGTFFGNQQRAEGQNREIELQKEFAQNGLRWKIEDAERAGIHPLAALGATGASYSPVGLGANDTAAGFSAAGDSFSRAIDATRTSGERATAYDQTVQKLSLTRMGLENELLASQIAQVRQAGHNPPFPSGSPAPFDTGDLTTVRVGGMDVRPNPGFSDAETVTTRYGEPAEWIYSPVVAGADVVHNVSGAISDHIRDTQKKGADRRRMYRQ